MYLLYTVICNILHAARLCIARHWKSDIPPSFMEVQKIVSNIYLQDRTLAWHKHTSNAFRKRWDPWRRRFPTLDGWFTEGWREGSGMGREVGERRPGLYPKYTWLIIYTNFNLWNILLILWPFVRSSRLYVFYVFIYLVLWYKCMAVQWEESLFFQQMLYSYFHATSYM